LAFNVNIGPCQTTTPGATFGVPIGPYVGIPVGVMHEAAGSIEAVFGAAARLSRIHGVSGRIDAQSFVFGRLQRRPGDYVPGQSLVEPYPVPMLWDYLRGSNVRQGLEQWAADLMRWRQEHATRAFRELARLGQEKAAQWEDN
jgi:hypothetical protein